MDCGDETTGTRPLSAVDGFTLYQAGCTYDGLGICSSPCRDVVFTDPEYINRAVRDMFSCPSTTTGSQLVHVVSYFSYKYTIMAMHAFSAHFFCTMNSLCLLMSSTDPTRDYVRDVNNHLQQRNNTTHLLQWQFQCTGAQHQMTHTAFLYCESLRIFGSTSRLTSRPIDDGQFVASGTSTYKNGAKQIACYYALQQWGIP